MSKKVVIGGLVGLGLYAVYQWNSQKASFAPASVPLGNIFRPTDPLTYVAVAIGAIVGKVV